MTTPETTTHGAPPTTRPWAALGAMCLGFFMILVDTTIVAVAQPTIMEELNTDTNGVVWVTSAYLLSYAVPLLITGRLGDRFGPKLIYQIGLVVFTAASIWCGLSTTIGMLVVARLAQGIGAALITPQTMAVITRIFPPEKRGAAMGVWGTVAGVATLVGPLLGGVLVDNAGWEWIFFINAPVGVLGVVLAWWLVPDLSTNRHRFDWVGITLSGIGLGALVFGIQDGQKYHWAGWVWGLIVAGIVVMGVFVWWQTRIKAEPLVPLSLFRDRNFSLSAIGIASMAFATTGMMLPAMMFLQIVGGMSPTTSALMMVPMATVTGFLAPVIGRLVDRAHPRWIIGSGLLLDAICIGALGIMVRPATPVWQLLIPLTLMGIANASIWGPLGATATRNLIPAQTGAGSGVYNTVRVVGSVLGSAGIGALMQARLADEIPGFDVEHSKSATSVLPEFARDGFSIAMGDSLFLASAALIVGVVAAGFFARPSFYGQPR